MVALRLQPERSISWLRPRRKRLSTASILGPPTSAKDPKRIDIPTLIVQGNSDRIVPFDNSGKRVPSLIKASKFVVIEGGPQGIAWTQAQ